MSGKIYNKIRLVFNKIQENWSAITLKHGVTYLLREMYGKLH